MVDGPNPTDDESFQAALQQLLQQARDNGIDVAGGWEVTTAGSAATNWDVQIFAVEYSEKD